jgi:Uri superfamily endonuclease
MKGSYILLIELNEDKSISIGKLGNIRFNKGYYAYIGSALNSLNGRIDRHYRTEKKIFWHIDYLLEHAISLKAYYKQSKAKEECFLANNMSDKFTPIDNFGSGDCKCNSHLFYSTENSDFEKMITDSGLVTYEKEGIIHMHA